MLLLRETEGVNGIHRAKYAAEFTNHRKKLEHAAENLKINNYRKCLVLGDEGLDPGGFSTGGFNTQFLVDAENRLTILYSDFDEVGNICKLLDVSPEVILDAIDTLEEASNKSFGNLYINT